MDFCDFLSGWVWIVILCGTITGLVTIPFAVRNSRAKDRARQEIHVRKGLIENHYKLRVSDKVNLEQNELTAVAPQMSFYFYYELSHEGYWLYVYDKKLQRHIVQPDDFNRYVEESWNWQRRVCREAGFTDSN